MRLLRYIFIFVLLVSCSRNLGEMEPACDQNLAGEISPKVSFQDVLPPLATKALVNQTTAVSMDVNFLRLDENIADDGTGTYEYQNWTKAYIVEGSVVSTPDSENNRSVYLNPSQSYKVAVNSENETIEEYYHTRMIGWHPRTVELYKDNNGKANVTFLDFFSSDKGYRVYDIETDYVSIIFNDLDGTKDVMVSDLREAQQYHTQVEGELNYQPAFGDSDNHFTFKHYLSAIQVYAKAVNSSQMPTMWGRIGDVIIRSQPESCKVGLPSELNAYSGTVDFGTEVKDYTLSKGPIFGDELNDEIAQHNPELTEELVYLGYSLIKPNTGEEGQKLILDLHTDSGIYSVELSYTQEIDGSEVQVFQPGYLYKIEVDFNTDGTISAILFKDDKYHYYDLCSGTTLGDDAAYIYRTSNCYIIDQNEIRRYERGSASETEYAADLDSYYDGYAFFANTMGIGDSGIPEGSSLSSTALDARSAALVWESKRGLITNVQLLYDYVRFRIPKPTVDGSTVTPQEGNAVIAVYDSNNEIIWSWHIWITDTPQEHSFTIGSTEITIMDRNLGATSAALPTSAEDVSSYGLYYQWGRKDPSMPPPSADFSRLSTSTSVYYDYYGDKKNSAEIVNIPYPEIQDAIQNPMYLILPTELPEYYHYDWLYQRQDHLWGYDEQGAATNKTIYDPCPFGYRVPKDEINTLMVKTFDTSTDITGSSGTYGITVSNNGVDTYFPYAGYKGVDRGTASLTGAWKYVGEKGDYMSANINRTNNHRIRTYLSKGTAWTEIGADSDGDGIGDAKASYDASYYDNDYANRRVAASVRCVKIREGAIGTIQVDLTASSDGRGFVLPADTKLDVSYDITSYTSTIESAVLTLRITKKDGTSTDMEIENGVNKSSGTNWTLDKTVDINPDKDNVASYEFVLIATNDKGVSKMKYVLLKVLDLDVTSVKEGGEEVLSENALNGTYYYTSPYEFTLTISGIPEGDEALYSVYVNGTAANYDSSTKCYNVTYAYPAGAAGTFVVEVKNLAGETVLSKSYDITLNDYTYTLGSRVTDLDSISDEKYYVIVPEDNIKYYWSLSYNSESLDFSTSATISSSMVFQISKSGSTYAFKNVASGTYVYVSTDLVFGSAPYYFTLTYNGDSFKVSYSASAWRTYYIVYTLSGDLPSDISTSRQNNANRNWYIYEVTPPKN